MSTLKTNSDVTPPGRGSSVENPQLAILHEITLALNSTMDPGELLDLLLDSCVRYTGATTGSVVLVGDDGQLEIVRERGLGADAKAEVRLELGQGVTGWVAEHGKPLLVPDVTADDRYVKIKEHIRSELAVPMVRHRKVVGVISVDSTRTSNFSEDDIDVLLFAGSQAAQILENAQRFATLKKQSQRDAALLEISRALGSALDLEGLFHQVMEILARRGGVDRGCLVLTEPGVPKDADKRADLSIVYAHRMTPEEMAKGRYQSGEGIVGRVFKKREPLGVKDLRKEPRFLSRTGAFDEIDGPVSFLAIPVLLEGEAVGVLAVVKPFPGDEEFDADLAQLQIVASTLSQAVKIYQDAAAEKAALENENRMLREELRTQRYRFDRIVGNSRAMQEVFRTVVSVAPSRSTVLIRGESGTGKELVAQSIHENSPRAEGPFVRVNCAAIPEQLLEAELFGHVKGSFTGAVANRKGRFAAADGGTIFLDEIGDMPAVLQAKILRVLQEREIDAVGSDEPLKVDVRILAATHQPLEDLVEAGTFREDLYYRLNVVPIEVPALRDRPEDIRVLAQYFLEKLSRENDLLPVKMSPDALRQLLRYDWPGNVRELENVIERAAIMCQGDVITAADLPHVGRAPRFAREPLSRGEADRPAGGLDEVVANHFGIELERSGPGEVWNATMAVVERTLIERALENCGGVRLKAAEILGIHRNTLRKKVEELGI
ncbi:MAG: sigma 54-interacting transcriptional regulator [Planctomycetota bacterium]